MKSKRFKFFLSHLTVSVIVALIIIGLVFFIWYPLPLAKAVGVTHIFLMLLTIDIIIGPILGFLVYKEGKKSLKFDLAVIILIQLSALCYGVYSVAQGRPVWIVYTNDRFELVRNNEIVQDKSSNVLPDYQKPSWFRPEYVAVKYSEKASEKSNDVFTEVMGGVSLAQFPDRYQSLENITVKIKRQSKDIAELNQFNDLKNVKNILAKYPQATAWLPLKASAVDMVVLINKEKGEVVKIVDLRPWK